MTIHDLDEHRFGRLALLTDAAGYPIQQGRDGATWAMISCTLVVAQSLLGVCGNAAGRQPDRF